ncbi:hypothetical protein AB1Y20_000845 [Prymnesium parvum]|uniref:Uncharacterized protein n=1 Tax=Prymnesium parvum TaxID=97485 RepID=A0AB34K9B5_PRYPA
MHGRETAEEKRSRSYAELPVPVKSAASMAAVQALKDLPEKGKFALSGVMAMLLGRHAADWSDPYCQQLLRQLVVGVLQLDDARYEALAPLAAAADTAQSAPHDVGAFVALLPPDLHQRSLLLCGLLVMLATGAGAAPRLQAKGYDARARQLLSEAAAALGVGWLVLAAHELVVAAEMKSVQRHAMGRKGKAPAEAEDGAAGAEKAEKEGSRAKWKRRIAVAGVGVVGGALIGVTGGLAAPAVIGGLAAVGGGISGLGGAAALLGAGVTGVATFLAGAGGVAIVTTVFGATGAGLAAIKMDKRLADVREFEFTQPDPAAVAEHVAGLTEGGSAVSLHVTIGVSGWLSDPPDRHAHHWFGAAAAQEEVPEDKPAKSVSRFWRLGHSKQSLSEAPRDTSAAEAEVEAPGAEEVAPETSRDRVQWLVAMGFPEDEVQEVVAQSTADAEDLSMEQMVDELLRRGVCLHFKQDAAGIPIPELAAESEAAEALVDMAPSQPSDTSAAPQAEEVAVDLASVQIVTTNEDSPAAADPPASDDHGILECLPFSEHHALKWESKELRTLGKALGRIAATEAVGMLGAQALKHTFFSVLMAACALPAYIIKACDILDQPWAVAYERANKAGQLLCDVLISRAHGSRPVILVGFGLGASLIFECLQHMARKAEAGDESAVGIVQHVVFMGLPAGCEATKWSRLKRVVAGRLVNCYRPDDLVLSLVYRASNLKMGVAGLGPVDSPSVENINVSKVVKAHHKYRHHVKDVLRLVCLEGTQPEKELAHIALENDLQGQMPELEGKNALVDLD